MAAPATEHVRNIVLVGQDGAGKTSLAEAMLYVSGKTPRMGTTHDGKSYLDYDSEEIKRKFTISTSIAPVPYKDYKINVLDTSGHPDFIGDTLATMQAAEMALFMVDAVAGPQVMTTKLWREAENMRLSRAVYINHIDRENANFDAAMATLHARFGSRLGAVTIPMGVDADFKGVIDVIRMKARYHEASGTEERVDEIPAEYAEAAQAARDKLLRSGRGGRRRAYDEVPRRRGAADPGGARVSARQGYRARAVHSRLRRLDYHHAGRSGPHGGHLHLLPASSQPRPFPDGRRRVHQNRRVQTPRCVRVQDRVRPVRRPLELPQGARRRARAGHRADQLPHGEEGASWQAAGHDGQRAHGGEKREGGRHHRRAEARRNPLGRHAFPRPARSPSCRSTCPLRSTRLPSRPSTRRKRTSSERFWPAPPRPIPRCASRETKKPIRPSSPRWATPRSTCCSRV